MCINDDDIKGFATKGYLFGIIDGCRAVERVPEKAHVHRASRLFDAFGARRKGG